jgi:ferrous iron transport protein B
MRLSELHTGETAYILKVNGNGAFRKRLQEMGLVRGQEVKAILNAPLKDPIKYEIMDYEVSLRRSKAVMIEITMLRRKLSKRKNNGNRMRKSIRTKALHPAPANHPNRLSRKSAA